MAIAKKMKIEDIRPKIILNNKYTPLIERAKTRYTIITGGRGSGKSYASTVALLNRTYEDDKTILFTRYTLTNAETSIIPEFMEKVKELGSEHIFSKSGNDIVNLETGGKILFRGIKTGTGINTASLKSIPKLKMWVNDESEELVDGQIFDTIDLSIRQKDTDCEIWLILNPKDINHFIYNRFFISNGVSDCHNGIKGDITYIHTTYLDNAEHLDVKFLELAEKCKNVDINKYNSVWLGLWSKLSEGLIYNNWQEEHQFPTDLPCWYGVDWGFANDPAAVVRICFDTDTFTIHLHELLYEKGLLTADIARVIYKDIISRERTFSNIPELIYQQGKLFYKGNFCDTIEDIPLPIEILKMIKDEVVKIQNLFGEIYCDPSRPEQIREMKINHRLCTLPAVNTDKTGRIEFLKYFNVKYTKESIHIKQEVDNYRWQTSKIDKENYINIPEDGNDHLMDAINYGAVTHLRRLGLANKVGEN